MPDLPTPDPAGPAPDPQERLTAIRERAEAGEYRCREHFGMFDADEDVLFLLAALTALRAERDRVCVQREERESELQEFIARDSMSNKMTIQRLEAESAAKDQQIVHLHTSGETVLHHLSISETALTEARQQLAALRQLASGWDEDAQEQFNRAHTRGDTCVELVASMRKACSNELLAALAASRAPQPQMEENEDS